LHKTTCKAGSDHLTDYPGNICKVTATAFQGCSGVTHAFDGSPHKITVGSPLR